MKDKEAKKSDSTELDSRVNTVYAMLLQGFQRKRIIQYVAEKHDVGERQIDNYIAKARDIMSNDNKVEIELKKSEILSQLYDLYGKNLKIDDFRECRNILNQIAEVLGVKAPAKSEVVVKSEQPLFGDE